MTEFAKCFWCSVVKCFIYEIQSCEIPLKKDRAQHVLQLGTEGEAMCDICPSPYCHLLPAQCFTRSPGVSHLHSMDRLQLLTKHFWSWSQHPWLSFCPSFMLLSPQCHGCWVLTPSWLWLPHCPCDHPYPPALGAV